MSHLPHDWFDLSKLGFIVINTTAGPEGVVRIYNVRGTVKQRIIKEGMYALNWTRLSRQGFVANRVCPSVFVLANNSWDLPSLEVYQMRDIPEQGEKAGARRCCPRRVVRHCDALNCN